MWASGWGRHHKAFYVLRLVPFAPHSRRPIFHARKVLAGSLLGVACIVTLRGNVFINVMRGRKTILLAEDDPDDAEIFQLMFRRATLPHELHVVADGQQAINWLAGCGAYVERTRFPMPSHLILDLKLPIKNGFEVLQWVRTQKHLQELPVIMLTSSDDRMDVKKAYDLGVTTYFVKTPHLQEVMQYLRLSS